MVRKVFIQRKSTSFIPKTMRRYGQFSPGSIPADIPNLLKRRVMYQIAVVKSMRVRPKLLNEVVETDENKKSASGTHGNAEASHKPDLAEDVESSSRANSTDGAESNARELLSTTRKIPQATSGVNWVAREILRFANDPRNRPYSGLRFWPLPLGRSLDVHMGVPTPLCPHGGPSLRSRAPHTKWAGWGRILDLSNQQSSKIWDAHTA